MASQIAHMVYARLYLAGHPGLDERKFVVGTVFPDIRYIAGIDRSLTHFQAASLDMVGGNSSSFEAGMYFHSVVDHAFNDYMRSNDLYVEGCNYVRITALKFMFDEIVYSHMSWTGLVAMFDELLPEELDLAQGQYVRTWHDMMQELIGSGLSGRAEIHLMQRLHFVPIVIRQIADEMVRLREDAQTRSHLWALDDELVALVQEDSH